MGSYKPPAAILESLRTGVVHRIKPTPIRK
jgi:hypothetical protein